MTEDCFHLGVKALIANSKGELLLLKKPPHKRHFGIWDLPGGRLQKDELPEQTLLREIYEETGLEKLTPVKHIMMERTNLRIPLPSTEVGLIMSFYSCSLLQEEDIVLSEEHSDFEWVFPQNAAILLKDFYPEKLLIHIETL